MRLLYVAYPIRLLFNLTAQKFEPLYSSADWRGAKGQTFEKRALTLNDLGNKINI